MAFPTVAGSAQLDCGGTAGTTVQAAIPSIGGGILAGDLILVLMARDSQAGSGTATGGFTKMTNFATVTSGWDAGWYYKVAAGGESGNVNVCTITSDRWGSQTYIIRGWTANPEDGTWSAFSSSVNPDPPNFAPSWGNTDVLWIEASGIDVQGRTMTASSGYGNLLQGPATGTGGLTYATARRTNAAASENAGAVTWSSTAANSSAMVIAIAGTTDKSTTTETGVGVDFVDTLARQYDDTGVGTDFVDTLDRQYDDVGVGTDFVDTLAREYGDTGTGDDQGGLLFPPVNVSDTGVGFDSAIVSIDPKPGHIIIGKFQTGEAKYTIENEILEYQQVNEAKPRPNVVSVDGNDDSWIEYDRDNLTKRDYAVNAYFDLPELKTPGEVRQRAVEELQLAQRRNSPGGQVVWMPWFNKGDNIYWVDEDHNRYETRIEGMRIEWNQSDGPFQRVELDTGILVFCPPDEEDETFVARDTFNRAVDDGLGTSLIGGNWNIFS